MQKYDIFGNEWKLEEIFSFPFPFLKLIFKMKQMLIGLMKIWNETLSHS